MAKFYLCLIALFAVIVCAQSVKISTTEELEGAVEAFKDAFKIVRGSCNCTLNDCMCCTHIKIKKIVDTQLCLNITTDGQEVIVGVDIGNTQVVQLHFSDNKQECFTYHSLVKLCVELDKYQSSANGTCGCFGVSASVFGINFGPFDVGCFTLGHDCHPKTDATNGEIKKLTFLNESSDKKSDSKEESSPSENEEVKSAPKIKVLNQP